MSKKWKVGIVGARGLSTVLGFRAIPDAEVTALCDIDDELLQAQVKRLNIPNAYRVYDDMLESDIDIVVVATPMQLHCEMVLKALDAGKHVLSEVTAACSMDELWWITDRVERTGLTYMMAENYCYIPQVQQVGEMIRKGLFGEIYYGEGEYLHDIKSLAVYPDGRTSWRSYWQLGKSGNFYPTHSLGPLMMWFAGDRVKTISCMGSGHHVAPHFRQEDTTLTLCQLESGKLVRIRTDCISPRPHKMDYYSVQGTKGVYEAPRGMGDAHKVWLEEMGDKQDHAAWRPLSDYEQYMPERYRFATEEQKSAGHWGGDYFIIEDFMKAVRTGAKPAVDVYDACNWTAVGLLSQESLKNGGKPVEIPDFRRK